MTRLWLLLFSLLTWGHCQIIYPDQYEIMKAASNPPYAYINDGPASTSNRQPTQYDQQFNPQLATTAQAAPTARPLSGASQTQYYPSAIVTTPAPSPQPLPQDWATHVNNIIARGITKFSLGLNKAIYNTKDTPAARRENTIFSPLSISVALSMVLLGSAGSTFNEVSQVLGLEAGVDISQHSEIVHQMFGLLLNIVNYRVEESQGPRVSSASGIFVQEGFPIRPEFRAISENAYKSEVINLDFRNKGAEAMNAINNWVRQRTMEKISSILSHAPDQRTNVILASALYFNGEWNQHFIDTATKRKQFFYEPNESIEVDMMYNGGPFPFYEDKSIGVKMVQLPYKGKEMSMYVLLPKAEGAAALRSFSEQLTTETIEHLISNLKNQSCIIGLPRMKLSSTLSLKKALRSLGLRSLFDPSSADLSILSSGYGSQPGAAGEARPYVIPQTVLPLANPQVGQTFVNPQTTRPSTNPQMAQTITSSVTPLPYTNPQAFPQAIPQSIPQAIPQSIPQAIPQTIPQAIPQALPQNVSRALTGTSQPALSNVLSQALPQALPQSATPSNINFEDNNNYLVFSRLNPGGNQNSGARTPFVRYEDKQRGFTVEQWGTGFHISNIRRIRRDTIDGRDSDAFRLTYEAEENHDDLRHSDRSDSSTKYVSLEENKYRFRNAGEMKHANRRRRQVIRPMDQSFLSFIQSQNFPYYGLDNLRNNAQLVNPGLFADEVLHKVEMEVTERGTEAAAATAVLLERDGNQKRLTANRPFLFFIRHDPTGLILFWGTVNTPTPNYATVR